MIQTTDPEPEVSAKVAGLRYVSDDLTGIERERNGKGFLYRGTGGKIIRNRSELKRITALAIPPAWTSVWICPIANGHLQAVGRDQRGRKQYRYHKRWREVRDNTKYNRMLLFAKALPKIRKQVQRDLKAPILSRRNVLATIVRLLETSLIRVGNVEYAKENRSFGLTTMEDRHVDVKGQTLYFNFRGKRGKMHKVRVEDKHIARIVRECQDLPGQELFQYVDQEGERQQLYSQDVNEYIAQSSGEDFTAKDFRTWAGTLLAIRALRGAAVCSSPTQGKREITAAVESVAKELGNTSAICRKCYIHPAVLESYLGGRLEKLKDLPETRQKNPNRCALSKEEVSVLKLLRTESSRKNHPWLTTRSLVQKTACQP